MNYNYNKVIFHTLASGELVKFTIKSKQIDNEIYYFANVVNTDLEFYKNLPDDFTRDAYTGVKITNGQNQVIYYRDENNLIQDLKNKYGDEWLESEINE